MRYVWDPAKDAVNRRKHGFSLAAAIPALEDPDRVIWADHRFDYARKDSSGLTPRGVLYIVYTEKDEDTIRIVSAPKASNQEIGWYGVGRS